MALRDEHLDLDATGGRVVVREGKGAKDRVVRFNPAVRDQLREWLDRRDEEAPNTEVVFPTRKGTPMSTSFLRQMVGREAGKAHIAEADRVSPHTLQHTAAVDLLRETERLEIVQDFLGHENISTTRRYARLVNGEVEAACRTFRMPDGGSSGTETQNVESPQEESLLQRTDPDELRAALLSVAGGNRRG